MEHGFRERGCKMNSLRLDWLNMFKPSSTISKLSLKMEVASHWLSAYNKLIEKQSN